MRYSTRLSWLYGGIHGSRMLIGAVNSMFLISRGVTLSQLAVLQIVYSVTTLLVEFPTGVLADIFSRKFTVLMSCLCLSAYYVLCLGAPDMGFLIASQIIYGFGLCLISGSLEGWITKTVILEHPDEPKKINYFGHLRVEVNALTTMISGPLGSAIVYFSSTGYNFLYILCASLMVLFFIAFFRVPYFTDENIRMQRDSFVNNLKGILDNIRTCLSTKTGWAFFGIKCGLTATYQVIFFYWQPFFVSLAKRNASTPEIFKKDVILLAVVFFAYSFSRFAINKYVRKKILNMMSPFEIAIIASVLCGMLVITLSAFSNMNIFFYIIIFALLQGTASIVEIITEAQFLKFIPEKTISSNLSAVNTFTRLLAIGILSLLAIYVNDNNLDTFFMGTSGFYCLILIMIIYWKNNYYTNSNEQEEMIRK